MQHFHNKFQCVVLQINLSSSSSPSASSSSSFLELLQHRHHRASIYRAPLGSRYLLSCLSTESPIFRIGAESTARLLLLTPSHTSRHTLLERRIIITPLLGRVYVRRALIVRIGKHRNHAQHNRLHRLHRTPSLARVLVPVGIIPRRV